MRLLSIFTILAFLGSCAAPPKPLVEIKPQFPTLDVALLEREEKMVISLAQAPGSGGTYYTPIQMPAGTSAGTAAAATAGAGLLAALIVGAISSVQQSNAKKAAAPLQEALGDTAFGPAILSAVEQALPRLSWTRVEDVRTVKLDEDNTFADLVYSSDAPGLLTISTNSFLSREADTLVFAASAVITPVPENADRNDNSTRRKRAPNSVYGASVSYEVPAPVDGRRRQDFIPAWADNNGAAVKAAAAQATPVIADMIIRQLQEGKPAIVKNEEDKFDRRVTSAFGQGYREKVQVLQTTPEGELVRTQSGALRFYANRMAQSEIARFAPTAPFGGALDMSAPEGIMSPDAIDASEDMEPVEDMEPESTAPTS